MYFCCWHIFLCPKTFTYIGGKNKIPNLQISYFFKEVTVALGCLYMRKVKWIVKNSTLIWQIWIT